MQLPGLQPPAAGAGTSNVIKESTEFLGIRWIGVNAENFQKLLVTFAYIAIVLAIAYVLRWAARKLLGGKPPASSRGEFWVRQTINILSAFLLVLGVLSIWFDDPTRLATAVGLVTAGLAFALQKVVTSVAGYFVILRGKVFKIGDRIVMGGVRGDVVGLGFTQTTILEMGQPPSVQSATPEIWVRSRQYTGRVVSVPNAKVFEEAIYNYSSMVPFIWEELTLPVPYGSDHGRAESILLAAARRHALNHGSVPDDVLRELGRQYGVSAEGLDPRVYVRMTDNWIELTARFVAEVKGVRDLKDKMCRELIAEFAEAGLSIASTTFAITELPALRVERAKADA